MINRRQAIQQTATATGLILAGASITSQAQTAPAAAPAPTGPHKLPPLPYAFDALEPHIDARTMEIHHDKHHAAYINNLNKAIADQPALQSKSAEELIKDLSNVPEKIRNAVRNNAGGHVNHSFFWQLMDKVGGAPRGALLKAIEAKFKNLDGFKAEFTKAAVTQFGSGWAWLSLDASKNLIIEQSANQDSPISHGNLPLLGVDVWEHAYYLKYQNRRPDYVAAFFNVVNWEFVSDRYEKAVK